MRLQCFIRFRLSSSSLSSNKTHMPTRSGFDSISIEEAKIRYQFIRITSNHAIYYSERLKVSHIHFPALNKKTKRNSFTLETTVKLNGVAVDIVNRNANLLWCAARCLYVCDRKGSDYTQKERKSIFIQRNTIENFEVLRFCLGMCARERESVLSSVSKLAMKLPKPNRVSFFQPLPYDTEHIHFPLKWHGCKNNGQK